MLNSDSVLRGNTELKKHCHINHGGDGDSFVGVRSDGNSLSVCFPIGYIFPSDDNELRRDILNLIGVLSRFSKSKDGNVATQKIFSRETVNFPVQAYIKIMLNYRNANSTYYMDKEVRYVTGTRGKKNWPRSIKQKKPVVQDNSFVYLDYIVQETISNDTNLITLVHEFCVYESYQKVGWLFPGNPPRKPRLQHFDKNMFLGTIYKKKHEDPNDKNNALFDNMISMIKFLGDKDVASQFYFGTDRFEYVWQNLIDYTFGVDEKTWFFPKTHWILNSDKTKSNAALEPDTIMVLDDKVFVIDAKYYRYGDSALVAHLPESTSINKQITYGEYIANEKKFKKKFGDNVKVYNAFLMPFGCYGKSFPCDVAYKHIGEAISNWKSGNNEYEHVQGILVDIRYLMHRYIKHDEIEIQRLADIIESATIKSQSQTALEGLATVQ